VDKNKVTGQKGAAKEREGEGMEGREDIK